MSLLNGARRFGGSLLDLARAYGTQQYSPISNPEQEEAAGEFAPGLKQQYNRNFRAARGNAVRQGARWWEMNDLAGAEAQGAYDQQMVQAIQVADALKQRRLESGRTQAMHDYINDHPDLPQKQKDLLLAMDEKDAAKVMAEQEFPDPNKNKFSMTALGNGSALLMNNEDGTTKIVHDPNAVAGLGGAGVPVNDDAIEMGAQQYIATGKLPPLGNSKAAAQARIMMLQRAAQIAKGHGNTAAAVQAQIAANAATRKSMDANQKQLTFTNVAEGAMLAHFKNAITASEKVDRVGVPVIDRWVQHGKKEYAGDPEVATFHAALQTAMLEYAKILSGGVQSAAMITEGARNEINELLSGANTHEQLLAVYDLVVRDAHAKKVAIEQERDGLRMSLNPYEQQETAPDQSTAAPPPASGARPGETAAQRLKRLQGG